MRRGDWTDAEDAIIQEVINTSAKIDWKTLANRLNRPVTMVRLYMQALNED